MFVDVEGRVDCLENLHRISPPRLAHELRSELLPPEIESPASAATIGDERTTIRQSETSAHLLARETPSSATFFSKPHGIKVARAALSQTSSFLSQGVSHHYSSRITLYDIFVIVHLTRTSRGSSPKYKDDAPSASATNIADLKKPGATFSPDAPGTLR